ncbi:MAG: hypothetical protein ACFFCW_18680 [Candidatus Hodarchaeota archaeon]
MNPRILGQLSTVRRANGRRASQPMALASTFALLGRAGMVTETYGCRRVLQSPTRGAPRLILGQWSTGRLRMLYPAYRPMDCRFSSSPRGLADMVVMIFG